MLPKIVRQATFRNLDIIFVHIIVVRLWSLSCVASLSQDQSFAASQSLTHSCRSNIPRLCRHCDKIGAAIKLVSKPLLSSGTVCEAGATLLCEHSAAICCRRAPVQQRKDITSADGDQDHLISISQATNRSPECKARRA